MKWRQNCLRSSPADDRSRLLGCCVCRIIIIKSSSPPSCSCETMLEDLLATSRVNSRCHYQVPRYFFPL